MARSESSRAALPHRTSRRRSREQLVYASRAQSRRRWCWAAISTPCQTAAGWTGALACWQGLKSLPHSPKSQAAFPRSRCAWWTGPMKKAHALDRSLFGSSAFAGTHTIDADHLRTDRDGVTYEDALRGCGLEMSRVGEAAVERINAAAYLELHIEQGPVLESMQLPLGCRAWNQRRGTMVRGFYRTGGALRVDAHVRASRRTCGCRKACACNPSHRPQSP